MNLKSEPYGQPPYNQPSNDKPSYGQFPYGQPQPLLQPPASTTNTELPGYAAAKSATPFRTKFASMSLHMHDRLRFLCFPTAIISQIHAVIPTVWPGGIQDTRPYHGSHEIKFRGYPWSGQSDDAVHARRLMTTLLSTLHAAGWVLYLSTDISRKPMDKDTLLFRYQDPAPAPCDWFTIAFSRSDRLRFIDAPPEIHSVFLNLLMQSGRVQNHGMHRVRGAYEIKLNGSPWFASGGETMGARVLLLQLLGGLEEEGWSVYCSADQKAGGEHSRDSDTWHVCRPRGWIKGMPVYHG